jgi:aminoglycoside/choline kinase family phosphotransferase
MILDNLDNNPTLGIIDFQDAMLGPITYDLVSLLKDCYIQWPTEQVTRWLTLFYNCSASAQQLSLPAFQRAFDLCGLQRHLKVLGVFCRLFLRDNKANYLNDLPLTRHYVMACLESYPELQAFYDLMDQRGQLPR